MLVNEHIRETIERFFACTHIPIQSYCFDAALIHAVGYTKQFDESFDSYQIAEKMRNKLLASESSHQTITCSLDIYFTACQICSHNINRGLHLIGPYSTCPDKMKMGIPYKPADCISHLVTLLYEIAADSTYIKLKNKNYNTRSYNFYINKTLDILDARYYDPITLEEIAQSLNITKYYLCSLFKKETGKTFTYHLNKIRIEKSKELLIKEHLSILDIALAVGYNSQNYYAIMFKKHNKSTPVAFRNQQLAVRSGTDRGLGISRP